MMISLTVMAVGRGYLDWAAVEPRLDGLALFHWYSLPGTELEKDQTRGAGEMPAVLKWLEQHRPPPWAGRRATRASASKSDDTTPYRYEPVAVAPRAGGLAVRLCLRGPEVRVAHG